MRTASRKPFNLRAFIVAMIALTGITLPLSGLFNHLHQFEPLTVARHGWMAAHNVMAILFAVFCGWHIVLNRRAVWNHVHDAAKKIPTREAALAGGLVAALLTLAIAHAFLASPE